MATTTNTKCSNNGKCSAATGFCPSCEAKKNVWLEAGRKAEVENMRKAARALPSVPFTREDEREFWRLLNSLPSALKPSRERGV